MKREISGAVNYEDFGKARSMEIFSLTTPAW